MPPRSAFYFIVARSNNFIPIFNIFDVSPNNTINEKYPPTAIAMNIDLTMTIRPLFMYMSANNNNLVSNLCQVYIYNFKTEIERVT